MAEEELPEEVEPGKGGRTIYGMMLPPYSGQVTIPIYEAGLIYSQVREAKQVASQRRLEVLDVRRQVREQVTKPGMSLKAAEAVIISSRTQVEANRLALKGCARKPWSAHAPRSMSWMRKPTSLNCRCC